MSSKNENTGLNRRKALKKMLAATPLMASFPLAIRAWGQPATFSDQPISSGPISSVSSSISNTSNEVVSAAPTTAPTFPCTGCPTSAPTCLTFVTFAPTVSPTAGAF